MPPAVVPESSSQSTLHHHHFDIVDEESLHLLVASATVYDNNKLYSRYYSSDDTFSTSIVSNSSNGVGDSDEDLSDEDIIMTTHATPSGFTKVWIIYYNHLQHYPLIVKSITAFILLVLADLLAQGVENMRGISWQKKQDHHDNDEVILLLPINWLRTLRFGVFGCLGAPWTHYYYHYLDTFLPPTPHPWTWTTFVKVTIDQGIQAPAMLALIISGLAFMEGRGWDGISSDMQQQYVDALIQNWKLWIPATVINIAFVKPTLRVLYDNLIFFVWTIYLSMILNDAPQQE